LTQALRWLTILPGMNWLPIIALGAAAFVATNVDDSFLLLLFFGDRRFRARHVFAGQALGMALLVIISLGGALLALAVPARLVGLLGLLPIAFGLKELAERRVADDEESLPTPVVASDAPGWRRAAAVAGITLANGGDNVGVYVPLFATRSPLETSLIVSVFAALLAVWLFAGYYLARRSALAGRVQRVSGALMPWVLIGLGVVILIDSFLY